MYTTTDQRARMNLLSLDTNGSGSVSCRIRAQALALRIAIVVVPVVGIGCGNGSSGSPANAHAQGTEGGSCFSNGACDPGLACVANSCVKPATGKPEESDSGAVISSGLGGSNGTSRDPGAGGSNGATDDAGAGGHNGLTDDTGAGGHSGLTDDTGTDGASGAPDTNAGATDAGRLAPPVCTAPTGTWSSAGSLVTGRKSHVAVRLLNGKVLVTGGNVGNDGNSVGAATASAEVYDPTARVSAPTGSMATARTYAAAALLPDGKVLMAGGYDGHNLGDMELYDSTTAMWSPAGNMIATRHGHTATILPNGKVLIVGGYACSLSGVCGTGELFKSAELYDSTTGVSTATGSMTTGRLNHTATVLADGKVLVAGGQDNDAVTASRPFKSLASAEVYDPVAGTWTVKGDMGKSRTSPTATLLPNGKVLVAGGAESSCTVSAAGLPCVQQWNRLASAELYDPSTGTWTPTGAMAAARHTGTATLLCNGTVLAVGGWDSGNPALGTAEVYDPTAGTWSATGSMTAASAGHAAVALADGRVLITGGDGRPAGFFLTRVEVY